MELAARMPERIKIRRGRLKHVLKEAVSDLLPRDILDRKKRGFGTPMGAWLKQELAPLVHELFSESAVKRRGLFRFGAIRDLIAAHAGNRIDGTDRLTALINLEIWARMYLDGRTHEDVADELRSMLPAKGSLTC
jgi:asparagine synthase (glutamine-hydrolysing)